ncbi:MAG: archease [Candidatus Micrarchaeaceae archaeon]
MRGRTGYRYVEHMADVKFLAYGKTREELFVNSAMALFNIMASTAAVEKQKSEDKYISIRVHAANEETLLWRFLQQCLSLLEVRGLFAFGVESLHISGKQQLALGCRLKCKDMDVRHSKLEAKGISKYDMHITKGMNGIEASVVVDV